jgi:hypothetical protein
MAPVLTGTQCLDALVEVIEGHGEMSRVASAERVAADDRGIELTAADDDDLVAPQVITRSDMALLHPSIVSPHRPRSGQAPVLARPLDNREMRKVVDSRLPDLASMAVFVATLLLVAFLWVWIGQWSLSMSAYPDTAEWWREFVLPRAAWSLLVGFRSGQLSRS